MKPVVKKVTENQLKDYSWDHSEKLLKLYLSLAGLGGGSSEKVVVSFTSESVSVRIGPLSEQVPKILTFNIK